MPLHRDPHTPQYRANVTVLDVHMTAQFLTVSADTVYDLFQRGDLPGKKVGRKWLTTKTAVLRWLEQSTKKNGTEAQEDAALARAIENGDREALVAAMHTGKARIGRKRQQATRWASQRYATRGRKDLHRVPKNVE
jgi:excisionase family DNA binding protein